MESQDKQIPMCSSSSSVPIENENEMFLQANEAIDEVIETQEGRFTSKAWKYFKLVKVGGARFSVCLTPRIDRVLCPTFLDEEEEPDSSCRPFEMQC
ncbi:hypothetical protein HAX54_023272 [Datura stramonium]|uniref:Uncharacterized protein n=1 Tax=Datura stramonium TaxID=4076 RepID=A0ABS8Y4G9_DATST|nr:hypothetical protein [Datura stramonium]